MDIIPAFPSHLHSLATRYLALLESWNRVHALTSLDAGLRMEELLLDAAALFPLLAALPAQATVVDFGSGMGIPAVPLAMARPDLHVVALEKASKKVAFLRQVRLELGLGNLEVVQGRAELLPPLRAGAGCAKAVGSLALLAGWWARHGAPGAPFYAFKGREWGAEPPPPGWRVQAHPYQLPTRGSRVVVEMVPTDPTA
jgi:16S rRNA (guanine527-N7)-methyltransferase